MSAVAGTPPDAGDSTAPCPPRPSTEARHRGVYAPLHHQDQKHFLRLHDQADGVLTIYPIGIEHVARKWMLRPDEPAHAPWFAPDGPEPETHLIEDPIRIERSRHASRRR